MAFADKRQPALTGLWPLPTDLPDRQRNLGGLARVKNFTVKGVVITGA